MFILKAIGTRSTISIPETGIRKQTKPHVFDKPPPEMYHGTFFIMPFLLLQANANKS
jgi:hypothetical protein